MNQQQQIGRNFQLHAIHKYRNENNEQSYYTNTTLTVVCVLYMETHHTLQS